MQPVEVLILGLLTEDEFALWEVAGVVMAEFAVQAVEGRELARQSLLALFDKGLIAWSNPPVGKRDVTAAQNLMREEAWIAGSNAMRVHATTRGTNAYLSTSNG